MLGRGVAVIAMLLLQLLQGARSVVVRNSPRARTALSATRQASSSSSSSRFWSRQIDLRRAEAEARTVQDGVESNKINITARLEQLASTLLQDHPDAQGVSAGIVLLPLPQSDGSSSSSTSSTSSSGSGKSILVPIHDGMLQPQHAKVVNHAHTAHATLCAFSPRAQHVVTAPSEEDRPVDGARHAALETALAAHANTTSAELLSEELAGTPPARIYRSFVAPRPGRAHLLEPVERAARRTAAQIDLALRQVRADRAAAWLRNTDRPSALGLGLGLGLGLDGDGDEDEDGGGEGGEEGEGEEGNADTPPPPRPTVHPVALVLDNLRSAFNVGSLFRTAETAALAEVVTIGITPHPPHPKLRKTAMSAAEAVPSRHFGDAVSAVARLREEGYWVVALETTSRSQLYTGPAAGLQSPLLPPGVAERAAAARALATAAAGSAGSVPVPVTVTGSGTGSGPGTGPGSRKARGWDRAGWGCRVALVLGNEVTGVDTRVLEPGGPGSADVIGALLPVPVPVPVAVCGTALLGLAWLCLALLCCFSLLSSPFTL